MQYLVSVPNVSTPVIAEPGSYNLPPTTVPMLTGWELLLLLVAVAVLGSWRVRR